MKRKPANERAYIQSRFPFERPPASAPTLRTLYRFPTSPNRKPDDASFKSADARAIISTFRLPTSSSSSTRPPEHDHRTRPHRYRTRQPEHHNRYVLTPRHFEACRSLSSSSSSSSSSAAAAAAIAGCTSRYVVTFFLLDH
jgi:hypothetical protein